MESKRFFRIEEKIVLAKLWKHIIKFNSQWFRRPPALVIKKGDKFEDIAGSYTGSNVFITYGKSWEKVGGIRKEVKLEKWDDKIIK